MPDSRAIGVFDSGLGGLTAVRELARQMPREDIVYFGDTARVPYGTRSRDTILAYTRQDIRFLMSFDIKAMVIACGTASTAGLPLIEQDYDFPVLGVVEPAARTAAAATKNHKVGLIGTQAAIQSGAYERILASFSPDTEVFSAACPLLVPLVENGRGFVGDRAAELIVAEYLAPIKARRVDTLILGCTHYPLLSGVIAREMGPTVTLVDSGREVACQLAFLLSASDAQTARPEPGRRRYYVSDSAAGFAERAALFLGSPLDGPIEKVAIETLV